MKWPRRSLGALGAGAAGAAGAASAAAGRASGLPGLPAAARAALGALMIALNALGLALFARALRRASSLQAATASLAANIALSGLVGRAAFGEVLGARCAGAGAAGGPPAATGDVTAAAAAADPEPEPLPLCYTAVVAYDGTRFAGFQLQAGRRAPTVQGELERALRRLTGASRRALRVQGAGRTDAGVHARGQCVQWRAPRALAPAAARRALNIQLPPDVRVLRVEAVPTDFNVRFSSGKEYWYDVHLGGDVGEEAEEGGEGEGKEGEEEGAGGGAPAARGVDRFDPFATAFLRYRHRPPRARAFDLAAAAAAAAAFEGEHDFGAFSSLARDGRAARGATTVRRVRRCALEPIPGGARLVVEGPGFLYKQVRHMAGAVLAAGAGRLAPADVAAALRAGAAGGAAVLRGRSAVAEARGLCLARVALAPHPGPDALMYPGGAPLLRREELAARELA